MKKLFSITCISLLLLVGINVPIFADDEPYVPSVGVRTDVEIYGGEIDPETGCSVLWDWCEDCHRKLVVTPYYLKETIESQESREEIDIAYEKIMEADKVSDLNSDVIAIANSLGASDDDLVIRDVFDITDYYCELQGNTIEITLTTEQLNNYVCLLHYTDDHFEVVPDAYITIDDCHLFLRVDKLSPFAIVVATGYNYVEPSEDQGCIWHWFIMITLLVTLVLAQIVRKKQYEDDSTQEDKKDIDKKNRKIIVVRDILAIINFILCVIFYILGTCGLDVYALLIDMIGDMIVLTYTHRNNNKEDEE